MCIRDRGYSKKETKRNPGGQMRKKKSEYATQLNEKQKVKFVYGILAVSYTHLWAKPAASATWASVPAAAVPS